jgi:hypothetical protein
MKRISIAILSILTLASAAWPLAIDEREIGISQMIPKAGETVTWRVPVVNNSGEEFSGEVTMVMRVARRGEAFEEPVEVTRDLTLAAGEDDESLGERTDFEFEWTPARNGWYRVIFEVPGVDRVEQEIAVTEDRLWFVWFGAPKQFRWCNVPTTVKTEEDTQWWLRRGGIPAHWEGGVCYEDWPVERFVRSWGEHDWIAIDEVGGPGEVTDKFIAAWEQLEEQKPDQFRAVWYMGAHQYWGEIDHLIDLFLPEIYLNYRSNHLGQFDSYLETAREAGVIEKTIPALGIMERETDRGLLRVTATRADVLRQFRYLKRTAPELNGIGFFTAYSAAPGVAEYADELCGKYFVDPVITIEDVADPLTIADGRVSATVRNVGGMDAEQVRVEWRLEQRDGQFEGRAETLSLASGEAREISAAFDEPDGWRVAELRIVPSDAYTVLDGVAREVLLDTALGDTVTVGPEEARSPLVIAGAAGPCEAHLTGPDGEAGEALVCSDLPARPGREETLVAFAPPETHGLQVVALRGANDPPPSPPEWEREGDAIVVRTPAGTLRLDAAQDAITEIAPADGENILRAPWAFTAPGHEGFGEARVAELSGALAVTIPWESEVSSGESQYVFFRESPVIRIARVWRPKGEVMVGGASDRCNLFQRGGTFALQRGVGGPVQRGSLQDGSDYRDILFGYLGGSPGPENHDRAGWIDFSYGDESGGMGVAIEDRWRDAKSKSYDVTRLYDASDWLEVLYVWGTEAAIDRAQTSSVWLVPHGPEDLLHASGPSATEALWRHLHADQLAVVEGLPQH